MSGAGDNLGINSVLMGEKATHPLAEISTKTLRVLLLNVSFNRYGGIEGHGGRVIPLNLCYLAAYGRQQHPEIVFKVLDAEIEGLSHEETVEAVVKFNPGLVAMTANTCVMDSIIRQCAQIKERMPDIKIMLGGPHPSTLPEGTLEETQADFAIMGEGELTFAEVLGHLKTDDSDYDGILGLAFRQGGEITVNSPRPYIQDLDVLPFPARDLVDNSRYAPAPTKRVSLGPNTLVAMSRGCPYDCGFCGAKQVWTRRIRSRSATSVVDEIQECVDKYGIRSFSFADELFTVNRERVLEICRLIKERNLKIRWVCLARAQKLDLDLLKAMKDAGCHEMSFGIESGSQEILERIEKNLTLDEARHVVELTKKAGITTHASYMFGYSGETMDTMRETLEFAKSLNTAVAAFFVASPLPGTPLHEEATRNGWIREDATWLDYSPLSNSRPVMNLPGLPADEIKAFHRRALRAYYLRPRYIVSRLFDLRHLYQIQNIVEGVRLLFRIK